MNGSQELEMMGGGDTRICKLNVVVRLRPPRSHGGHGTVWVEGSSVHVADSKDRGFLKDKERIGSRVYHVTAALPAFATQDSLYNAVGVGALDTLWDGFNSAIVSMGGFGSSPLPSCPLQPAWCRVCACLHTLVIMQGLRVQGLGSFFLGVPSAPAPCVLFLESPSS
jgi:hypothetical protein